MAKFEKIEGAQFVRYFGPVLDALRGLGGSGTPDEVVSRVASGLALPDSVQNDLLPSGQSRFRNQVAWARFYLVREGYIDSSRRGIWSLTPAGKLAALNSAQSRAIFLKWVKIFQDERKAQGKRTASDQNAGEGIEDAKMEFGVRSCAAQSAYVCVSQDLTLNLDGELRASRAYGSRSIGCVRN